jgi:hypothetical protein
MRPRSFGFAAFVVGALFLATAYGPDLGGGFVKDDAPWIETARAAIDKPASALMVDSSGLFFRPLVTASFAADYLLHGLHARGYGLTNLLLCIGCIAAIGALLRELGLSAVAASAGLLAWTLNPHGVGMALLWISGRTSLLMALFSTIAVLAFMRREHPIAALFLLAALLAKEDAVAVPAIAVACMYAAGRLNRRDVLAGLAWMAAAAVVYFTLRLRTSAMTPATAPWYYQLLTNPASLAINTLSYLDRAGTSAAIVTIVAGAIYGAGSNRRSPDPSRHAGPSTVALVGIAGLWFTAGLAITVRIPVRSDLYAVFPSIGPAIACGALVDWFRSRAAPAGLASRDRLLATFFAALLFLVPVYRVRNARFTEPARLSTLVQERLAADRAALPDHGTIVFEDAPAKFSTFGDAFDGMSSSMVRLFTGRPFTADILIPPDIARQPDEIARYALRDGSVVRVH